MVFHKIQSDNKVELLIEQFYHLFVFYKEYPNYPHGIWDIAFEEVGLFDQLLEYRLSDRYDIEVEDVVEESTVDTETTGKSTDNTQLYVYTGIGVVAVIVIAIVLVLVMKKKKLLI